MCVFWAKFVSYHEIVLTLIQFFDDILITFLDKNQSSYMANK